MRNIFILLTLTLLYGCGTTSGRLGELPVVSDKANAGKVVVVRISSIVGAVNGYTVALDGKDIFGIGSGEHAEFLVPAGEHFIGVKCFGGFSPTWKEDALRFSAKSMETSYFLVSPSASCAAIRPSTAAEVKQSLESSKLISLDK